METIERVRARLDEDSAPEVQRTNRLQSSTLYNGKGEQAESVARLHPLLDSYSRKEREQMVGKLLIAKLASEEAVAEDPANNENRHGSHYDSAKHKATLSSPRSINYCPGNVPCQQLFRQDIEDPRAGAASISDSTAALGKRSSVDRSLKH